MPQKEGWALLCIGMGERELEQRERGQRPTGEEGEVVRAVGSTPEGGRGGGLDPLHLY